MNCCDQSMPNNGCDQGRNCPARNAPAIVATARPLYRRCDLMGVCQSPDAACKAECLMVLKTVQQAEPVDDELSIDQLVMRVLLVLVVALTVVIVAGLSGFAWEQRLSLVELWAALQDVLWALAARWS